MTNVTFGSAPVLYGSLPAFTLDKKWHRFQAGGCDYKELKQQPHYNMRNNIPMDTNWGRSGWPFNGNVGVVRTFEFTNPAAYQLPTDYVPLAYEAPLHGVVVPSANMFRNASSPYF